MATNGMTIDGLNTVTSITAQDKVPVWDNEATGEPTRKITGQNLANSVKSLASLPNTTEMNAAIAQSTAYLTNADILLSTTDTGNNITLSNSITNYLLCEVLIVDSDGKCLNSIIIPTEKINEGISGVYPSYYSDSQIVRYITFNSATKVGISSGGGNNIRVIIYGLFKRRS